MTPSAQLVQQLASEIAVKASQIEAAIALLDDGASVPFIARYRKEATEGLDDTQLRLLETRLIYIRDLNERREKIIESITSQQKLTPELQALIEAATSKTELEDLYLPYRPKKTSKASKARDAGFEPLALRLLTESIAPSEVLVGFKHDDYPDEASQLDAMSHILIDHWAQDTTLLALLRQQFSSSAMLCTSLADEEKRTSGQKFRDYFDAKELFSKVVSHRLLAMLRGKQENVLTLKIEGDDAICVAEINAHLGLVDTAPEARREFLLKAAHLLWHGKLRPHLETSLMTEKRNQAEADAIKVFAENLRHLLLAAPAGSRCTLGVDPGIRTGVKLAVVDTKGDVLTHSTIYPFQPKNDVAGSLKELKRLCTEYPIDLVAIGNGTASRESEQLISQLSKDNPELNLTRIVVSEAGASVYSASELASKELPELDVSIRGAVSIARRLQDPLAELVKIDPKSIGVGQYQHDVSQTGLAQALNGVVEDCVNAVGVDVNTASPALLARVAGLNTSIAQQIADFRSNHGQFTSREQLKKVPRLGARTFEQAAGFLRIQGGSEPLDASAVHPESYPLVSKILALKQLELTQVLGKSGVFSGFDAATVVDEKFGLPTVLDVLSELEKPGRDPRPEFRAAKFREDIVEMKDLREGMILEGAVTNVTNFGAFIDVGVHQDGLVHISELSNTFVDDPQKIVKPGQIVQTRVISVDVERKRIALSLNLTPKEPRLAGERVSENSSKPSDRPHHRATDRKTANGQHTKKANSPSEQKTGSLGALLLQAGLKQQK